LIFWLVVFRKNGKLSEWSDWSTCDKSCGGGTQTRTRKYIPASGGGSEHLDKNKLKETQPCNTDLCKIDGRMSEWVDMNNNCKQSASDSANEISCGPGFRKQSRSYIPPANEGLELDVNSNERKLVIRWVPCSKERCTDVDGYHTEWVNIGNCVKSKTDNTRVTCKDNSNLGEQKQIRTYIPAIGSGNDIPSDSRILEQWVTCDTSNMQDCPVIQNAVCSEIEWDASCTCRNNKYQISKKKTYTQPTGGGTDTTCDTTQVWVDCNSSNSNNSTFSTLASSIKNLFTPNGLCPSDATLGTETQDPDNTCTNKTTNATTGRNRTKFKSRNYTFPIGKAHHQDFSNMFINNHNSSRNIVNEFNILAQNSRTQIIANNHIGVSKKYYITRTNNTIPQQYKIEEEIACADAPIHTTADINSRWNAATGCTTSLTETILANNLVSDSYNNLQYLPTQNDIDNVFTRNHTRRKVYDNISTINDRIANCYGGLVTFTRNDIMNRNGVLLSGITLPNKITRGVRFSTIDGNLPILRNGDWTLWLLSNGNLVMIYGAENDGKSSQLTTYTFQNYSYFTFTFEDNGYVSIHKDGHSYAYGSGTSIDDARYLHLTSLGNVKILNNNQTSIHLVWENARGYLKYVFYNNCPNAMFADKEGRFFSFIGSEYPRKNANNENIEGTGGYSIKEVPSDDDSSPSYTYFRGWRISPTSVIFTGTSERNLIHIDGYYKELNTNKPISESDDTTYNYNSSEDRTNFFNDGGNSNIDVTKIRKPRQFPTGGMIKSNYLPGYERVSYVNGTSDNDNTFKFLVSARTGWDQAFVLFQKLYNIDDFATSIIQNHTDLITEILKN
jgi:hypothetical protein